MEAASQKVLYDFTQATPVAFQNAHRSMVRFIESRCSFELFTRNRFSEHLHKTYEVSYEVSERQEERKMRRVGASAFDDFGDLFLSDVGSHIFAFLKLPDMPRTLAASRRLRDLTRQRTKDLLAVSKILSERPFKVPRNLLLTVTGLFIRSMELGQSTIILSFAQSISSGAFPKLKKLFLRHGIGDAGLSALANAMLSGALRKLVELRLRQNRIGDEGMKAFSSAMATGALANLTRLHLAENQIGDAGMKAFSDAIRSGALGSLKILWLYNNEIGDAGMSALAGACASGALPKLEFVTVWGNPGNTDGVVEACRLRKIDYSA